MSISFIEAVDAELATLEAAIAELVEAQYALTPRIFVLRSQRSTLQAYRLTLAIADTTEET